MSPVEAGRRTGTVVGLWSYPVKSLQGRPVDALDVGPDGVVGDRRWALVSPDGATVLSAKRHKRLLKALNRANWRYDAGPIGGRSMSARGLSLG